MQASWHLRGGRILDPGRGRIEERDLLIVDGCVAAPGVPAGRARDVDVAGMLVMPGFIDMHVHLREPGGEEAETVASGSLAAARGGFAAVGVMPNTKPPMDSAAEVEALLARGRLAAAPVRLLPCACITRGRAGRGVAPLAELAAAGAVAFTDDGSTVADRGVLREALQLARALGRPVLDHALDPAARGVMHEGAAARRWGLPGIPSSAEASVVERDVALAAETGCALHIQHVSARESVELIRSAQRAGVRVTAEATPHHLILTDDSVDGADARFKMSPPLRSAADREALLEGLADGTIGALATDHAPHSAAAKGRSFVEAPFGVVGLETALALTWTHLVLAGRLSALDWAARWTLGPAGALAIEAPALAPGMPADVTVFDPRPPWTIRAGEFVSRSRNTPFEGLAVTGRPALVFRAGARVWPARCPLTPGLHP